ncbi:MAG: RICIN domain-containing protein [Prevotella sp.]|nr:RICIN domain-containing protein [Prevotella sp.]
MKFTTVFYSFLYLCSILTFLSCQDRVNKALLLSDENRSEIETVLNYYHNSSDSLKCEAAEFLIENMPYHYSYDEAVTERFDSIYLEAVKEPDNQRHNYYKEQYERLDETGIKKVTDIATIKSDYLVSMIEYTYDIWTRTKWHDLYDKSIFYNYVLPYRLSNEPLSDWHQTIDREFPLLNASVVLSRRGQQYEAEDTLVNHCSVVNAIGASRQKAVMLTNEKSSLSFNILSERKTLKRLIVKYTASNKNIYTILKSNGNNIDTLHFYPTRNLDTFNEKWFNISIPLEKGRNELTFFSTNDTIGIDYIQLGAIEPFSSELLSDFSSDNVILINKRSLLCVNVDTVQNNIELKPRDDSNKNQLLCLNYCGYPLWEISTYTNSKKHICLEMEFGVDRTLSPDSMVTTGVYENRPFQQWVLFPIEKDCYRIMNKHTGMFLDSKYDKKTGKNYLVQNPYSESASQQWLVKRQSPRNGNDSFFQIDSSLSEALRVFDITHQFQFFTYPGSFLCKGSSLIKAKAGKCIDEANYTVYLCRHLGIPATVDFTPHWGNRSNGHSWSVIIKPNGEGVPFYMGNVPGDTVHYFHPYRKPKVFRSRFQINDEIADDMKDERYVPRLFRDATFIDVTDEYYHTTDIIREIPNQYKSHRIAYICVFDNREWVPTYYGRILKGKVKFRSMGREIMYIVGIPENGQIKPIGNPFFVNSDGTVTDIITSPNRTQSITLLRKYPFMGEQDYFNSRMSGGKFQGSKQADFLNSTLLHEHQGITNGNWYDIPITNTGQYKYLRYIGPKGSFCNINELEFYGEHGEKLVGKIIGTEGESWGKKEKVFDGNILTGFGAKSPDGNWVGLALEKPAKVSRIRYIGRNDGNCVETDDEYILYCWRNNEWETVGAQTAASNQLTFHNIPTDGLYVLSDITKGSEERIFTYQNGKQIWW